MPRQLAAVAQGVLPKFFLAVAFAGTASLIGAPVEDALPAVPDRYVTDRAGVLPSERAEALNSRLEQFERETSNQILVWIDRRLPEGLTLEEFALRASDKWKPGQAAKDNGAVLFVFVEDRKVRIETRYGLEGALPDAICKRIIDEQLVPRFRAGDYADGIEAAVVAMIAATQGEYRGSGRTVAEGGGRQRPLLWGCVIPLVFLFFFLIPLFRLFSRGRRGGWRTYGGSGWWTGGGGWGSGGGSSGGDWSSGGGGGFSGGGGAGGGGGASGSW